MAATLCRLGMKEAAVFVCWKHSQALTVVAAAQRCTVRQHQSSSSSSSSPLPPPPPALPGQPINTTNIEGFELSSPAPAVTTTTTTTSTTATTNPTPPNQRPVVVLIGWLNAKPKHLLKYQELYWQRGFDVLTMKVSPIHIVRPKAGIKYTAKLLNVLQENKELCNRQVVVHGFSIGAFIYTQLQLLMQRQQQRRREQELVFPGLAQLFQDSRLLNNNKKSPTPLPPYDLGSRIAGLVLDSPAYIDHMCSGIANSITASAVARAAIKGSLQLYLAAFPKSVTFHYHESHRAFHYNAVPALILHSEVDLVSSSEVSDRYIEEWRQKGVPAFSCKFPSSSHVTHFRNYPEQYTAALHAFLGQLRLRAPEQLLELEEEAEETAAASASASAAAATAAAAAATAVETEVQPLQAKVP